MSCQPVTRRVDTFIIFFFFFFRVSHYLSRLCLSPYLSRLSQTQTHSHSHCLSPKKNYCSLSTSCRQFDLTLSRTPPVQSQAPPRTLPVRSHHSHAICKEDRAILCRLCSQQSPSLLKDPHSSLVTPHRHYGYH
jgi:hypothetical protein